MLILELILLVLILTTAYAGISAAPWFPSNKRSVERFLKLSRLAPGEKMYDLGCGDGRFLLAAAAQGATATGYEISLLFYLVTQVRRLFSKNRQHIHVHFKSFWNADLRDADVVYVFLMRRAFSKLREKLERELKPGTRVICHVWPIEGWEYETVDKALGSDHYLYIVPPHPSS